MPTSTVVGAETSDKSRESRILDHMPLVEKIARQVAPMFARRVPMEDLVSSGYVGLVDAANRIDPERQEKFPAYAYWRIRGAMIDAHKRRYYREEQHDSLEGIQERLGYLPARMQRDNAPLPDELAERQELQSTVAMLLGELPALDAALLRAVMAGEPSGSAARALGRSPAWGRARLVAARDRVGAGLVLR